MDIKKYEVLLNTLNRGCFAKACEDLGYSQPAITHMMKSMEREIGLPLLRRSNKGIQLTNEGQEVLPLIQELVKANERLNQKYDELLGGETGRVRVGCFPTMACAWMPKILREFEARHPNIHIELLEENSLPCLENWLTTGFVDLCLISKQPKHTFRWFPLKKDPFYALMPMGHPLAEFDAVPVKELEKYPFLACRTKDGRDADIDSYLERNGTSVQPKFTSNLDYTIGFMVREGLGVSILPGLILKAIFGTNPLDIAVRKLDPPAYRELGIAVRAAEDISPAMNRFIRCAQDVVGKNL